MAVFRIRNGLQPLRRAALTAVSAAVLAGLAGPAQAQGTNVFDELLEKLKSKGVLTEDEYQALKAARDEEITEQRAERRRQALRQAQEALRLAQFSFQQGASSLLEVLDAQRVQRQILLDYALARHDLSVSLTRLEQAVGGML